MLLQNQRYITNQIFIQVQQHNQNLFMHFFISNSNSFSFRNYLPKMFYVISRSRVMPYLIKYMCTHGPQC